MEKIVLPDYACRPTFKMHNAGNPSCLHEWEKDEEDDYIRWTCRKCPARAGCEVLQ